jgi:hypothetical protein
MTISIAWIRKSGMSRELIVASDSRLTSVGHVDICQKVFPLPRGDAFLAFCGETILAFPFLFQVESAIEDFQKSSDRSQDVTALLGRVLELLNLYRNAWRDTDAADFEQGIKTTRFLFGGWSWRFKRFFIYPIHFNKHMQRFQTFSHSKQKRRLNLPVGETCVCIGNYTAEFRERLGAVIAEGKLKSLNYEPLDVLCGMLGDDKFTDRRRGGPFYGRFDKPGAIGGAPQAIKLYEHANTKPIAIRWWVNGDRRVTLFGRPLFDWERTFNPIYNPEDRDFFYPLATITDRGN